MHLRSKVVILISVIFFAMGVLTYTIQYIFILPNFESLENKEALNYMVRTTDAIKREIAALSASVHDWASWDELYQYAEDRNEKCKEENLNSQALEHLKINLLYLYDSSSQLIWGQIYDLDTHKEVFSPDIERTIQGNSIFSINDSESAVDGIIITSNGPMLLSARPILNGLNEGPARGTLIMGRFINTTSLAELVHLNLEIQSLQGSKISNQDQAIASELGNTGEIKIHRDKKNIFIHKVNNDLFGNPAILLASNLPRDIYANGKAAINFSIYALMGSALILMLTLLISLRKMIIEPLQLLTEHAILLGKSGNFSQRISMIRKDEFGQLANEFNGMVKRLAKVHEFLAEQSYHLGIAEMARGVLHNIGNAVTPLGVKLDTLKGELVKAPVQEIEMAAAELDNPSTPSDRRADLQNFLELAGIGLSDTVKSTTQGIYDALRHVNHIQRILVDQHRLSKAQGVVEKLEMSKLLSDAVRLVPEKILKSVDIKLDPNISQVCEIYSNRIVVEQVISNLIINAYESINENSQRSARGTINIHAFQHPEEGLPVMHLCIEDNGTGISEENIKKLFIYGFSTKNRGSGMGLHWCSNAIVALKGRIYAESKGADQGAVFHLLLPCGDEVTLKKELSNEH